MHVCCLQAGKFSLIPTIINLATALTSIGVVRNPDPLRGLSQVGSAWYAFTHSHLLISGLLSV